MNALALTLTIASVAGAGLGGTEAIVWSCVALSLLWADLVLQIQEWLRTRSAAVKVKAAAAAQLVLSR